MINIDKKSGCCGCSACEQICPKRCIIMKTDTEGFFYPSVEISSCINCRICEEICPVMNATSKGESVRGTYVAYAKDETVRLQSSSGGIFTLFAEYILNMGGVVFGAAFDNKFMVHHISVDNLEGLKYLRGSKYLQSRIEDTYIEAKNVLESGKPVLYSGTACQIAGLHCYLRKEYRNLYTVDVLCHGVPSPKVWEKYLSEKQNAYGADIRQIIFRKKNPGWKKYFIELQFSNNKVYESSFIEDPFMQLFLSDICLRPSCYDCKFKHLERPSDLTIGDCWGIERYMPDMDDDKGTSVVLVHSEKGQNMLKSIVELMVLREAETDRALSPSADSRNSVSIHKNRDKFFALLERDASVRKMIRLIKLSMLKRIRNKLKRVFHKVIRM